jgi:hypothetical protein
VLLLTSFGRWTGPRILSAPEVPASNCWPLITVVCTPEDATAQRTAIICSNKLKAELWGSLKHIIQVVEDFGEGRSSPVSFQYASAALLREGIIETFGSRLSACLLLP